MRRYDLSFGFALLSCVAAVSAAPVTQPSSPAELVSVRKVWDGAPHNAFTDLIRFKNQWFLACREASSHLILDGTLRVLTSADGETWTSTGHVTRAGIDLRDPKLAVTPDGRLMLSTVAAFPKGSAVTHRTMAWFSADGKAWGEGQEIAEPNFWLWRPAWHQGKAYGVGYATTNPRIARLYSSPDGVTWQTVVPTLAADGFPNESALLFGDDDTCLCLLRRDGTGAGKATALLGRAKPPYTDWEWKDTGTKIGGPVLCRLPDGRLFSAVRLYDPKPHTSLCQIDPAAGTLTETLPFPSGGDTSYAGMVFHDGLLWVSYYSSHEGKTSIYLAEVRLPKV